MNLQRRLITLAMAGFAVVLAVPGSPVAAQTERIIISGASGNLGGLTVDDVLAADAWARLRAREVASQAVSRDLG